MSIRKVSDLETAYLTDGSMSLSDVEDSLLEFSVPDHSDNGHSFKSMKTRYSDVRLDLLSAVLSSGEKRVFATSVDFTKHVNMYAGLNLCGDLYVNYDNPDWQDTTVYVKGGDVTLYGDERTDIYSNDEINLSAPAVYAYADSFEIKGFSDSSRNVATFGLSSYLYSPLSCSEMVQVPTTSGLNVKDVVNVEYLENRITDLMSEIRKLIDSMSSEYQLVYSTMFDNVRAGGNANNFSIPALFASDDDETYYYRVIFYNTANSKQSPAISVLTPKAGNVNPLKIDEFDVAKYTAQLQADTNYVFEGDYTMVDLTVTNADRIIIDNANARVSFSINVYTGGFPPYKNIKGQTITTTPQQARADGMVQYACTGVNNPVSGRKPSSASDCTSQGSRSGPAWYGGWYVWYPNAKATRYIY